MSTYVHCFLLSHCAALKGGSDLLVTSSWVLAGCYYIPLSQGKWWVGTRGLLQRLPTHFVLQFIFLFSFLGNLIMDFEGSLGPKALDRSSRWRSWYLPGVIGIQLQVKEVWDWKINSGGHGSEWSSNMLGVRKRGIRELSLRNEGPNTQSVTYSRSKRALGLLV